MFRAVLRRLPAFATRGAYATPLVFFGALLLPSCCDMPMGSLLNHGPAVPGPLSSGMTPQLWLTTKDPTHLPSPSMAKPTATAAITRTAYQQPPADLLPMPRETRVDLDLVLRMARERNARIVLARERVNEAQIILDVANNSCMPEFLRKDTFKRTPAAAQLWRRRGELSKMQFDVLQDAANTYFDALTARRGVVIARELEKYDEQLRRREQALVDSGQNRAKVLVESVQLSISGRRQYILQVTQQAEGAEAKLAYLIGMSDSTPVPIEQTPEPIDLVDATVPVEALVAQAQENGPGVRDLQGLAGSIQQGINEAQCAQYLCNRTGAFGICGRLQIAQSNLRQAELALVDLRGKLRAGVEEARAAILEGRARIVQASNAIKHGAETYRLLNLRLDPNRGEKTEESLARNTYGAVQTSIQQLSQAHGNYLSAVNDYNKAQVRLLLLLGTNNDCGQ